MKTIIIIMSTAIAVCGVISCKKKEVPISEKIGDALNTRPNEKLKDAVEDIEKDAKKAGEGLSEAIKDAADKADKKIEEAK
ncbi:MAG: hypothetical protein WCS43_01505 [Verrucomicrobiota bacterium]